jgi:hypothetical protein
MLESRTNARITPSNTAAIFAIDLHPLSSCFQALLVPLNLYSGSQMVGSTRAAATKAGALH